MLFKKFLKPSEPVQANAANGAATPANQPVNSRATTLRERREFPRALPVPDVVELDWATWDNVTEKRDNDK
jgi:hypothetical protein